MGDENILGTISVQAEAEVIKAKIATVDHEPEITEDEDDD